MEKRARGGGCGGRQRGEHLGTTAAFALMLATCTSVIVQASADTATVNDTIQTASSPPDTPAPTLPEALRPGTASPSTTGPGRTSPAPIIPQSTSYPPTSLNSIAPGLQTPGATTHTATPSTASVPTTASLPTTIGKLATTASLPPTIAGSSKTPATPQSITSSSGVKTPPKTITPAEYVVENVTGAPAPTATTAHVSVTPKDNQTQVRITSGSEGELTTVLPTVTSIVYETIWVTESLPVEITAGKATVEYVTLNATTAFGGGFSLDPDHERDELKKLLMIIGASIGAAVVAILISFAIVYILAKRRNKRANSRYYNFKKKKSNYEKVLHLQEYYGELDTDTNSAGTGAAWVFQENDPEANKTITLEMNPKDKEKPAGRSGKKTRSKNKNKNNRNKGAGRGNYQVLAEMFPTRNIPPDVLLSAEGAVHSTSEEEDEDTVMDTSFGPLMMEDTSGSVLMDGLASKDSFNDGVRSSWPAWNTSPYVTITQEDAVVEL